MSVKREHPCIALCLSHPAALAFSNMPPLRLYLSLRCLPPSVSSLDEVLVVRVIRVRHDGRDEERCSEPVAVVSSEGEDSVGVDSGTRDFPPLLVSLEPDDRHVTFLVLSLPRRLLSHMRDTKVGNALGLCSYAPTCFLSGSRNAVCDFLDVATMRSDASSGGRLPPPAGPLAHVVAQQAPRPGFALAIATADANAPPSRSEFSWRATASGGPGKSPPEQLLLALDIDGKRAWEWGPARAELPAAAGELATYVFSGAAPLAPDELCLPGAELLLRAVDAGALEVDLFRWPTGVPISESVTCDLTLDFPEHSMSTLQLLDVRQVEPPPKPAGSSIERADSGSFVQAGAEAEFDDGGDVVDDAVNDNAPLESRRRPVLWRGVQASPASRASMWKVLELSDALLENEIRGEPYATLRDRVGGWGLSIEPVAVRNSLQPPARLARAAPPAWTAPRAVPPPVPKASVIPIVPVARPFIMVAPLTSPQSPLSPGRGGAPAPSSPPARLFTPVSAGFNPFPAASPSLESECAALDAIHDTLVAPALLASSSPRDAPAALAQLQFAQSLVDIAMHRLRSMLPSTARENTFERVARLSRELAEARDRREARPVLPAPTLGPPCPPSRSAIDSYLNRGKATLPPAPA